ncbi:hypothetical protein CPB84DRAFT_1785561 [Gymnopilus junonius]|uniref:F-box domain-containing protein n=1 Tax=Gymnopilus junonius TaxID=109634 RepID=A0A9P5NI46_GYMJU|nr:hypothetical protein CPB84DRAFT_1785561 [Gymnopilus junonius]
MKTSQKKSSSTSSNHAFKTLITCQSTCKSWRNLIQTADIALAPARRHLLTFYNSLMRSSYFHYPDSTPNVKPKPQPKKVRKAKFNHEAEADCLRKYFQNVPDAFVMWTREWPGPIAVCYHSTYFGLRPKMVQCLNYGTYEMRFWLVNRTKGEIWQVGVANARRACECPGVDKSRPYGIDPMQHQPHKRFEICLKILEPNK